MDSKFFFVLCIAFCAQISLVSCRWYAPCSRAPRIELTNEKKVLILEGISSFVEASALKNVTNLWKNNDVFTKCFSEYQNDYKKAINDFKAYSIESIGSIKNQLRPYHNDLLEETKVSIRDFGVVLEKYVKDFSEKVVKQHFIAALTSMEMHSSLFEYKLLDIYTSLLSIAHASHKNERDILYEADEVFTKKIRGIEKAYKIYMKDIAKCMQKKA